MKLDLNHGCSTLILQHARKAGLDRRQTAYVMATASWETAGTMEPVREAYYLGHRAEPYRKTLRYYPAYGRGFVQLTWARNYAFADRALGGIGLTREYDLALQPEIAAQVLVKGARDGWFTGVCLSDHINATGADYVSARRIINGRDCAEQIAEIARRFEAVLSPVPSYPHVRFGDSGRAVAQLQTRLLESGYTTGAVDGIFGVKTKGALRRFQSDSGLDNDAIAGPHTWAALIADERVL